MPHRFQVIVGLLFLTFCSWPADDRQVAHGNDAPQAVTPNGATESPATDGPGPIGELDQFVASFEMNSRARREQPLNGEPISFNS